MPKFFRLIMLERRIWQLRRLERLAYLEWARARAVTGDSVPAVGTGGSWVPYFEAMDRSTVRHREWDRTRADVRRAELALSLGEY